MEEHAMKVKRGIAKMVEVPKDVAEIAKKDDKGARPGFSLVCMSGQMDLFKRREGSGGVGEEILGRFEA